MVPTCLPATADSGVEHERTALPSRCTVHAPHRPMPQPYLVPLSPKPSRIAHNSGVSAGRSVLTGCPLRMNSIIANLLWGETLIVCALEGAVRFSLDALSINIDCSILKSL